MEQEYTVTLNTQAAKAIKDLMSHEDLTDHALRVYIAGAG